MSSVLLKRICGSVIVTSFKRFKTKSTEVKMSVFIQKRNSLTGELGWAVENDDYDYHQEIARSAFADMLHDHERNQKYYQALQLAIIHMRSQNKKANVLDIGTGTGLLSMMAAELGADTITACEAFKPMAECCQKILAQNGFDDKIKLVHKRSTEITVGEGGDMPERANILITEVFDTELIGEGALSTFTHAQKYLLEKDSIVIPDSATIYAQVVECPIMQTFNKINDINHPQLDLVLKSPEKMKNCAGSAAVHDIQLSQLSRTSFTELSDPIPVFKYDWTGKTPLVMKQMGNKKFTVTNDGMGQMVFMWWDLVMWPGPKEIILSCAPWWKHPDVDINSHTPDSTIPWRDHWMQAVYYFPHEIPLKKDSISTLVSCQDEYSLWFYMEDNVQVDDYKRPICECGVHMTWSRTHVSSINDEKKQQKYITQMKKDIKKDSIVLDLNGTSLLGLVAAKMAKKVYIYEESPLNINILKDFIESNNIDNVKIVSELREEFLKEVTHVIFDSSFSSAILPWDGVIKLVSLLYENREYLRGKVIPEAVEIWAMPVCFRNLQMIRQPLDKCFGFDMTIFDDLVENSRELSDDEIEAQPLWEYRTQNSGTPRQLLRIELNNIMEKYELDETFTFEKAPHDDKLNGPKLPDGPYKEDTIKYNGFALWCEYDIGHNSGRHSTGLQATVDNQGVYDMHSRQAVKILKEDQKTSSRKKWTGKVKYVPEKGVFNIDVNHIETK